MSDLREQLHAARSAHRAARFPGDLGLLVDMGEQRLGREAASGGYRWRTGIAAAAVLLLVCGVTFQISGKHLKTNSVSAVLPSLSDIHFTPRPAAMNEAVKTLTPPEVPELLMQVKQPLVASGEFIVNIGKDVAHHADALFHMG
jgi:hypothetical protein